MLEFLLRGETVTPFIVIGAVGLALVLLSLVLGEVFEGLFDFDAGGGMFSGPVLGSFLASFGFGAALIIYTTDAGAAIGALGGLGSGIVVGGIALVMMRSLLNMPTDETVTTTGLTGAPGIVITTIPEQGFGEVTIRHHGSQNKYNARALTSIPAGSPVRVTAVLSSSAVQVEPVASD
ncbi:NfeD family protein [Egicoccus sp. AB-alg6-2]|uniref:NfeD family protein n=1 Tax=Egicoccus sp. AB-alg6-2 TaxID=3242692 RepID=UPI00359EA169